MWLRRAARLTGFFALCFVFLAAALVVRVCLCAAPGRWSPGVTTRATQVFARALLKLLGWRVRLCANGRGPGAEPALIVANHQSYLDIPTCAAHFPPLFVAKQELRRWPLLG